jgi:hypothetical protein
MSKRTITWENEAREYFKEIHGEPDAVEWVIRGMNCYSAEIDASGDVWIEGPQSGHWLSDDELIDLANAIENGV